MAYVCLQLHASNYRRMPINKLIHILQRYRQRHADGVKDKQNEKCRKPMHTSYVLLGFDNGEEDTWFYLTPANYNKKKMGGWSLGPAAEIRLADFMRSPPDEPSIVV